MKILALSDWRVQSKELLLKILDQEAPDFVLYAGDDLSKVRHLRSELLLVVSDRFVRFSFPSYDIISITKDTKISTAALSALRAEVRYQFSRQDAALRLLSEIPFVSVRGNDDVVGVIHEGQEYHRWFDFPRDYGKAQGRFIDLRLKGNAIEIHELRRNTVGRNARVYLPDTSKYGCHMFGSGRDKFTTLSVGCMLGLKSDITEIPRRYADIYLSHVPPLGVLDLSVRFGLEHIGSSALRRAVLRHKPRFVVCGHSHFWEGSVQKLGSTTILNVSNSDRDPSRATYAVIDSRPWGYQVKSADDLSRRRVAGFGSVKKKFETAGLASFCDFDIETNAGILRKAKDFGIHTKTFRERLKSLSQDKPRIKERIPIPTGSRTAYVDVETGLSRGSEPGRFWLVGISHQGKVLQFMWPKNRNQFLAFLREQRIDSLIQWTTYDSHALNLLLSESNIEPHWIDACQLIRRATVWHSYKLDDFYITLFGENKKLTSQLSGRVAGIYANHILFQKERCSYCPSRREIQKEVMLKNKEDLLKMVEICNYFKRVGVDDAQARS